MKNITKSLSSSKQIKTSIIIPAYKEAEGLAVVLEKLFQILNGSYEVIVVDDGSPDETGEIASLFPYTLIRHEQNRGKGCAMKTGYANAKGENIIFIDADNTYPVNVIPDMVELLERFDMVVASRMKGRENVSLINRVGNFIFSHLIRYLYGSAVSDPLSGLYGLKNTYFEHMQLNSNGFAIETEITIKAAKMNLKVTELLVRYNPRMGKQKLSSIKDGWKILQTILREKFKE